MGLEVVATELQQRGRGRGEQQPTQTGLVMTNEPVEVVREGKHDVEVWNGQQVLGLLL